MARQVKLLLLYAPEDNLGEHKGELSTLAKYLFTAIGEGNVELRLWGEWEAGTADAERERFAAQADLIINILSVNFLLDKTCQQVVSKFGDYSQATQQKQASILFWACPWTSNPRLLPLTLLPKNGTPVVDSDDDRSVIFNEIAEGVAALVGMAVRKPVPINRERIALQYACNRTDQLDAFQGGRMHFVRPPRFYFLHGTEEQSHDGFAARMQMELIGQFFNHQRKDLRCSLQTVHYPPARDRELAKRKLLAKLHDHFGLDPDACTPIEEQRFGRIIQQSNVTSPFHNQDMVLLLILVNDFDFERGQTAEVIRWANDEFFTRSAFHEQAPEVIVLWGLIYTGEAEDEDDFTRYRRDWESLAKSSEDWLLLPEMEPVHKREVKRWLQEYAPDMDPVAQDDLISTHFGDKKTMDMVRVQRMLATVIRSSSPA